MSPGVFLDTQQRPPIRKPVGAVCDLLFWAGGLDTFIPAKSRPACRNFPQRSPKKRLPGSLTGGVASMGWISSNEGVNSIEILPPKRVVFPRKFYENRR